MPEGFKQLGVLLSTMRTNGVVVLTLVVVPMIGLGLLFFTEGKLRGIGLGFFVYSFSIFVVLPALFLAAGAQRGSHSRLFAAFACFLLAFFTYFYLMFTATQLDNIAIIVTTIPIALLGLIFAIWWARDLSGGGEGFE